LKIFAIVPVKSFENAKSRFGSLLSTHERIRLSGMLLERTISTLKKAPSIQKILLVSADARIKGIASDYGVTFLEEIKEAGVNSAVKLADEFCFSARADASLVLPTDLPLIVPEDIGIMCKSVLEEEDCVILCPSYKFDGSNVLLRKPCNIISTSYDKESYPNHVLAGIRSNVKTRVLFLDRLMIDIDTVNDIKKMLSISQSNDQITRYMKTILTRQKR
jgi:2-phospho-L-lactate/phosphoenolpyruvate guanylyltransferase